MENAHNKIEQIERYILQEMEPGEQAQFEQLLTQDEELAAETDLFANLLAGIAVSEEADLRRKLDGVGKKLQADGFFEVFKNPTTAQPEKTEAIVRPLAPRRRWLAIAASVILASIALYLFWPKGPDFKEVYAQNFAVENTKAEALLENLATHTHAFADPSKESAQELSAALEAYKTKNYKAAVPLFEAFLAKYPQDMAARFYFGISLMEVGNFYTAIPNFEEIIAAGDPIYLQESQWYQALSLLRIKAVQQKGVQVLEGIATDKTHPYSQKAATVLKNIE